MKDQIAAAAADEFLLQLRQWLGFDLQPRVRERLLQSFTSAIEKDRNLRPQPHFNQQVKDYIESRVTHASEPSVGCICKHRYGDDTGCSIHGKPAHASEQISCPVHQGDYAAHCHICRANVAAWDIQQKEKRIADLRGSVADYALPSDPRKASPRGGQIAAETWTKMCAPREGEYTDAMAIADIQSAIEKAYVQGYEDSHRKWMEGLPK